MEPAVTATIQVALKLAKLVNDAALKQQIQQIQSSVDAIGNHLAEDVMSRMRAGFDHLSTGAAVTDPALRTTEFTIARGIFNELANRRGGDGLLQAYAEMTWEHVSAMGYLGNYSYFLLRGQPEMALINAYRSVEKYPLMGVRVLPRELFSATAFVDVTPAFRSPEQIRGELVKDQSFNAFQRREWKLDMAWRVPAAAGYVVAGLAGSVVSPALAGHGLRAATGLLAGSGHGALPERRLDARPYLQQIALAQKAMQPLVEDARSRRELIERQRRS